MYFFPFFLSKFCILLGTIPVWWIRNSVEHNKFISKRMIERIGVRMNFSRMTLSFCAYCMKGRKRIFEKPIASYSIWFFLRMKHFWAANNVSSSSTVFLWWSLSCFLFITFSVIVATKRDYFTPHIHTFDGYWKW